MPEYVEVKIMSEFINDKVSDKKFDKIFDVVKGNIPNEFQLSEGDFRIVAESNGKELVLNVYHDVASFKISVFMGMSGNWKFVQTDKWNETKFVRMRMDTTDGWSLLLYGGYMGPKYKLGGFTGVKRGPDPLKENDKFKKGVLDNIGCKEFDKPLGESLLNQKYFNGIGAYLLAEIVGRLDYNPHRTINQLCNKELEDLFNMIVRCFEESYSFGGGEIKDWQNPFGENRIDEWLMFYNNKEICYKQKFGTRNIWIHKKWKTT
jgi:endonuclease VIII-like 1